jgi:hypothetical protein
MMAVVYLNWEEKVCRREEREREEKVYCRGRVELFNAFPAPPSTFRAPPPHAYSAIIGLTIHRFHR